MKKYAVLLLLICLSGYGFGQSESFGQNKVQYKYYNWHYIQTHNFDIYFDTGQDSIAYFAADVLEDAYSIVSEQLEHELTVRVPVIIYSSPNDFQQTNVVSELLPEGVGGFTEVFKTRIVVPFDGSYEDFRHVLHHELTHAVTFNMLYENAISSLIARQAFFSQPLWLAEGFAEYSSRKGWTYDADMNVRDAVINGYLPPIPELFGLLNYKAGHALLIYIAETYGEQKISEINNKGKVLFTIDRAIDASLSTTLEKISKDWHRELKRVYWPELAKRQTVEEIGKLMTDHQKDGSQINMNPAWSPKGDRIAITSDRGSPQDGYTDRFTDIYLISAIDGSQIEKLVSAEKSGDLESLHSYYSGMAWSPDGSKLAFVTKSNGQDALFFVDAESKKIYKKFKPGMGIMKGPDWSTTSDNIVFTGVKNNESDLYIYDLTNDELTRLTSDKYDDLDADFSPDGTQLVFASDRPVSGVEDSSYAYGLYNIFTYDIGTGSIKALTNDDTKSSEPEYSPDGKHLAYVSYRNGISNIYVRNLETGDEFPVTNIITGVFSPNWSPDGDKIAVSVYNYYGFDVAIIKDIKPISEGELEPTVFRETGRLYPDKEPVVAETDTTTSPKESNIDYSRYIFRAGMDYTEDKTDSTQAAPIDSASFAGIQSDTLEYMKPDGTYAKKKYKPKFAPELIAGGFSYDNFYGLQGQSYLSISDMMGNHQIYIMTDVFNTIDQSNVQIVYNYLAKRINYSAGAFHFKDTYYKEASDEDPLQYYFSDRIYGAAGYMSYPLSKFKRIDLNLSQVTIERENLDYPDIYPKHSTNLLLTGVSYVNDGVIWGIVGPVYGQRYKFSVEHSFKLVNSGLSYSSLEMDYRKYLHFGREYNFAFRFAGGTSFGDDARRYNLGGTSYWISPERNNVNDIYTEQQIYINKIVVPLRGYRYFELSGKNYALMNLELRFPFIDYFKMRWPLGLTLAMVRGSIFCDIGAAFDKFSDFGLFDKTEGFPKLGTYMRSGIGFSAQANLGIFVLRYDQAWHTDFDNIAGHPEHYFSLGANY